MNVTINNTSLPLKNLGLLMDIDLKFKQYFNLLVQNSYSKLRLLCSHKYILNNKF